MQYALLLTEIPFHKLVKTIGSSQKCSAQKLSAAAFKTVVLWFTESRHTLLCNTYT